MYLNRKQRYRMAHYIEIERGIHEEAEALRERCNSPDYVCRNVVRWRRAWVERKLKEASNAG